MKSGKNLKISSTFLTFFQQRNIYKCSKCTRLVIGGYKMYRIIPIPKELVPPEVWVILIRRLNDYKMKNLEGTASVLPDELVYELGLTNTFVLVRMKRWQDYSKKGYATVSNAQLAKDCNMSESTIKNAKKELIKTGYIMVSTERVNKTNTVSKIKVLYEFKMTAPKKEDTPEIESTKPTINEEIVEKAEIKVEIPKPFKDIDIEVSVDDCNNIEQAIRCDSELMTHNHYPYCNLKKLGNKTLANLESKHNEKTVRDIYETKIQRKFTTPCFRPTA